MARANVPLSVTLTACTTLLSPLVTPLAMRWLAGRDVPIDAGAMFWSIVWTILAQVVVGLVIHRFAPGIARRLTGVLPPLAMAAAILAAVWSSRPVDGEQGRAAGPPSRVP